MLLCSSSCLEQIVTTLFFGGPEGEAGEQQFNIQNIQKYLGGKASLKMRKLSMLILHMLVLRNIGWNFASRSMVGHTKKGLIWMLHYNLKMPEFNLIWGPHFPISLGGGVWGGDLFGTLFQIFPFLVSPI